MSEERLGLPIRSFDYAPAWEAFRAAQPRDGRGLWLKLAKKGNSASALTRAQAVDDALIHGWIDGQAHRSTRPGGWCASRRASSAANGPRSTAPAPVS